MKRLIKPNCLILDELPVYCPNNLPFYTLKATYSLFLAASSLFPFLSCTKALELVNIEDFSEAIPYNFPLLREIYIEKDAERQKEAVQSSEGVGSISILGLNQAFVW